MIKGKKEGDDRKKERKVRKTKKAGNKRQKQKRLNEKDGKEGWMDGKEEGRQRKIRREGKNVMLTLLERSLPASDDTDETVSPSLSATSCFLFSDTLPWPYSHPQRSPAFNVVSLIRTWAKHTHTRALLSLSLGGLYIDIHSFVLLQT